jgi:protein SCO1/2
MSGRRALLLGSLLLVPVLAFLFLQFFGKNEYRLKTYYPVVDENTDAPLVQNGDTVFQQIPDFRFISQEGKTVTQQDLNDQVYVANFIFSSCKDICKKMTSQMSRVQEAFREEPAVKLVSYTVDPDRDSVATLKRYADQYGANADKWYFLTGPKAEIYQLAQQGYKLPAMAAPSVIPDFIHSDKFILVDKQKRVRGIYNGTEPEEIDRLITEIKILLQEKPPHEK